MAGSGERFLVNYGKIEIFPLWIAPSVCLGQLAAHAFDSPGLELEFAAPSGFCVSLSPGAMCHGLMVTSGHYNAIRKHRKGNTR